MLDYVTKSESYSVMSNPLQQSMEFSRPEYWSWVAFPFSRGSSQPRDQTQVSHIAGGFFIWTELSVYVTKWLLNANISKPFFEGGESLSLILEIANNIKF